MKISIVCSEKLLSENLKSLFSAEILAYHIPNFVSGEHLSQIGEAIAKRDDLKKYYFKTQVNGQTTQYDFGVSSLGVGFSTTFGKPKNGSEHNNYYSQALPMMRLLRDLFHPHISPIDKLRLELDEIWSGGATVGNFDGKKMLTGIVRVTHPHAQLLESYPHVDSLPPNYMLSAQISANMYLTTPSNGGELLLWPTEPATPEQVFDATYSSRIHQQGLGSPLSIKPAVGDLILINTRRFHAVKTFGNGYRVSIQSFMGLCPDNSIKLWC